MAGFPAAVSFLKRNQRCRVLRGARSIEAVNIHDVGLRFRDCQKGRELSPMPLPGKSGSTCSLKLAVTEVLPLIVTVVGLAVPVTAPDHPIQG